MTKIVTHLYLISLLSLFSGFVTAQNDNIEDDPASAGPRVYAERSVLAQGDWYKVAVGQSGICRISYSYLQSIGVDMAALDPRNVKIFGNGGGMLPESNAVYRHDDLKENAIEVVGESDGVFDVTDYILFYSTGPVTWKYNSGQKIWEHRINTYTDSVYYFISTGPGRGKRIPILPYSYSEPTHSVTSYGYRTYHDRDVVNLIKSGRNWYGEVFDITPENEFTFNLPDLIPDSALSLKIVTAARATLASTFTCSIGGTNWKLTHSPISTYYNSPYASGAFVYKQVKAPSAPVKLTMTYGKSTSTAVGWLDYINLTARCNLQFRGGQMEFRDLASVGEGNIALYRLSNSGGKAMVWDVTDPLSPKIIETLTEGNDLLFSLNSDTLREFIAFDISSLIMPRFTGKVQNQDLHGIQGAELVIIAPPVFYDHAVRLASYRTIHDDISTLVLTPEVIYNEFSSGAPDVIAVRDFLKMLYDRGGESGKPKYLLLFGDGSYDNKNRLPSNTNFIPTWQTAESFDPVRSGVSDDYFGLLDDTEGLSFSDVIDIGIGRLPVKTIQEAEAMVDKIIHYSQESDEIQGDWRNVIAFVADDEDGNEHIVQADNMASFIEESYGEFNIDKIYMDAYLQQSSTAGTRYPEVNKTITQRVEKGCIILNYTGHGGETGWAHEQVLEVQDINGWSNYSHLPVFVTATCEFSRFDDPGRTSAGELVFLNERGGGIALFTTTRPTYGSPNFELNKSLYKYALSDPDKRPRMGDVMKLAKRESGSDENGRKFILLGDPSQAIAFPQLSVATTSVNGRALDADPDTLRAFEEITITGQITDKGGNLIADFNGIVYPTIFDKAVMLHTFGNDGGTPYTFSLQKSILYRGKVQVTAGEFSFTFIVPKDIAYRFDYGKLSYYASDGKRDASGYYSNLVVGGSSGNPLADNEGPEITLYMNDENFVDGGMTDENPWLIAFVTDENGINTIGSGIGHDITAILDGETDAPYILNDFYEADVNTFRSGKIRFPLALLEPGEHSLTLKVWDIFNNSSQATIRFAVHDSEEFVIRNARNFPNPFIHYTDLDFEHNQQGRKIQVRVDIHSLTGQHIATLEQEYTETGTKSTPLRWDGRTSNGSFAAPGMYLYVITARTSTGAEARSNGKLILSN